MSRSTTIRGGVLAVTVALAASLLAGTSPVAAADGRSVNDQPVSKLRQGGTLTLPIANPPVTFNTSHPDGNSADLGDIMSPILPSFMIFDKNGNLIPDKNYVLDVKLTRTKPQTVVYTLNPKAVWSDGKRIGLADFQGMWRALNGSNKDFEVTSTVGYEKIQSVRQGRNANEIVVVFKETYPDWQPLFGGLLPASVTATPASFKDAWKARPTVSAGPFIYSSASTGNTTITLTRNPRWWGRKPVLDRIVFRSIPAAAQFDALANGETNFMDLGTDANAYKRAQANSKLLVHDGASATWEHIDFNPGKNPILRDVRVRQAIAMGLNRQVIAEANTGLTVANPRVLNNRVFMPGLAGNQDNMRQFGRYNRQAADRLLDQAGWIVASSSAEKDSDGNAKVVGVRYYEGTDASIPKGKKMTITFTYPSAHPNRLAIATLVQAMLKPLGIDLVLREVPRPRYFVDYITLDGDFEMAPFAWVGTAFPISSASNIYKQGTAQNYGRIGSAQIDQLWDRANSSLDANVRRKAANDADWATTQLMHSIPLYQWPGAVAVTRGLANFGAFGYSSIDWTIVGFMK